MLSGIYKAYMFRFFRSIKFQLAVYTILTFGLVGLMVATAYLDPELFTPTTRRALEGIVSKYLSGAQNVTGRESLMLALTAIYTPFVVALISSLMTASTLSQVVIGDKENGLFEVLLSRYSDKNQLLNAILLYTVLAGLTLLVVVSAVFSATTYILLNIYNYGVMFTSYYAKLLLLLAPSITLLTGVISLIVSVKLTSISNKKYAFTTGNVGTLISSLPGLIPLILVSIDPGFDVVELSVITMLVSLALFALFTLVSNRYIRSTDLIA